MKCFLRVSRACAVVLTALSSTAQAELTLTPTVSFEYVYDSNLPQNITGYGDHYGTPALKLRLYRSHKTTPLMFWVGCAYQNYLKKRSSILNEPVFDINGLIKRRVRVMEFKLVGSYADYRSPQWHMVKAKYRLDPSFELELGRNELTFAIPVEWRDYGQRKNNVSDAESADVSDDDALEIQGEISYVYDFKVFKSQRFAVRDIGLDAEYVHRLAMDDGDYQAIDVGLEVEIKAGRFAFEPHIGGEYRVYDARDKNTRTEELVRRVNRYLNMGMDIEFELTDWAALNAGGVYKSKKSTYSLYTYDRYVLHGEIEISPGFTIKK